MNKTRLTLLTLAMLTSMVGLGYSQTSAPATAPASAPAPAPAAAAPTTAPASGPASAPATSQSTTQTTQEAVDPAVLKILDAQEKAGERYKTIQGNVNYTVESGSLGDVEVRTGYVMYQKDSPKDFARFRIHFETLKQGADGPTTRELVDYAFGPDKFDSQWLTIAEHANRKIRQIQVAPAGKQVEPLRIGKGPFPLPFGQKTQDVLDKFTATTRPPQAGDPEGTDYLKLVPKAKFKQDMNFVELQMWLDRKLGLPVKVISREANKTVTTVLFDKLKLNEKIDPSNFLLERPAGWKLEVTPLEKSDQ